MKSKLQHASHLSDEPMFHSWVYVHFGGEDSASFFMESTTGERRALGDQRYAAVNCLWNQVSMAFSFPLF